MGIKQCGEALEMPALLSGDEFQAAIQAHRIIIIPGVQQK